jgi:periodic tryptophan protein 2
MGLNDRIDKLTCVIRYFISTSKDMTCRIHLLEKNNDNFRSSTLAGHRDYIINAWFSADMENVSYSISHVKHVV